MRPITKELAQFISSSLAENPDRIRLEGKEILGYSAGFVADQIEARQRYFRRFPKFCADPHIIFPPRLNLEQSSSEATAVVKADFMLQMTGNVKQVIDLTAGFGVDAWAMTKVADQLTLIEPNDQLRQIAQINFERITPGKTKWIAQSANEFINAFNQKTNWIYLDPSRRQSGNKVYRLEDCTPDPVALMDTLLVKAEHVLIKTSPMLDVTSTLRLWNYVKNILIVSVSNECREVIYHLSSGGQNDPNFICLNIKSNSMEAFHFRRSEEKSVQILYHDPMNYIFEPNASVLKAGAFKLIAERFGLKKLAVHTHLFTSDQMVLNFPGRIFEVIRPLEKIDLNLKANIISRNHPMTTDQIRKKFKVSDGGDDYIIACSGQKEKFLLLTRKIKSIQSSTNLHNQ